MEIGAIILIIISVISIMQVRKVRNLELMISVINNTSYDIMNIILNKRLSEKEKLKKIKIEIDKQMVRIALNKPLADIEKINKED